VFGQEWWNSIVCPYTDAANLTALQAELDTRWGPTVMMDGIAYTAYRGTHSATGTWGSGRNHHLVTAIGTGIAPQPPYIWAAVYAAVAAASLSIDPARPLQTLPLTGILPPVIEDRWTLEERNLLLYDGIATSTVDAGGRVLIERAITTYQQNSFGVDDPSYLDVNTPATLSYIRYATRARITQKFPRMKLADDGTRFSPGQAIVTPSVIRAELIALFRELESAGLVEGFDQYKTDLIVERDANDPNRVNVLSSPDLVNQFRVFAEQIQFIV
jgi:phage tail sheath gpL-like